MSRAGTRSAALRQPEPDLKPDELVRRAASFREQLRAEQDQSEAGGCHPPELQDAFVRADFYRALQPQRFGGYEFGYAAFYKAMDSITWDRGGSRLLLCTQRKCCGRRPYRPRPGADLRGRWRRGHIRHPGQVPRLRRGSGGPGPSGAAEWRRSLERMTSGISASA